MITFKYGVFQHTQLMPALFSLSGQRLPAKVAYSVGKLLQAIRSAHSDVQKEYIELLKKYVKLDATGNIEIEKDEKGVPNGKFIPLPGKEEELKEAIQAFTEDEVKIDRPKLLLSELGNQTFTADELLSLEPIIEADFPAAPGGPIPLRKGGEATNG